MISKLQAILDESRSIVFFGGAGVSTESGIPDFRSAEGLYHTAYAYPPEEILSHRFFLEHTGEFYRFYRDKLLSLAARPNPAHAKLAQLEQAGRLRAVVTQNIDGLHQKAGSQAVYELHGSIHRNHCMDCGAFYPASYIAGSQGVPRCACGGMIKPDVVLYGEPLDADTVQGAVDALLAADTLLIAGTSLTVYPAAGMISYFRGKNLVLINRDPTPQDGAAQLVIHDKVGVVLEGIRV